MINTSFLLTIRDHRKKNYWDVTYDKDIDLSLFCNINIHNHDFSKDNKPTFKNIYIGHDEKGKEDERPDKSLFLENIYFSKCDFSGNNKNKKITIKNCRFKYCYFSFSSFNDAQFLNCTFECCSFSQSRFYRCFFSETCSFYNISISGGSTLFKDTAIKASSFFKKIYEPFKDRFSLYFDLGKDSIYEKYRLQGSKLKLSKVILESNKNAFIDDYFYDAVKVLFSVKQKNKNASNNKDMKDTVDNIKEIKESCKLKRNKNKIKKIKLWLRFFYLSSIKRASFFIEMCIMRFFGYINGWGGSLPRVCFFGFFILIFYTLVYVIEDQGMVHTIISNNTDIVKAKALYYFVTSFLKSLDITFLAGYTKHVTMYDSVIKQSIMISNFLIGIFWYAVFIPTLINKISVAKYD